MDEAEKLRHLSEYADGRLGTRDVIERLGLRDYADLIVELARHDLPFPKPDYPGRAEHLARARAILGPRLRRDAG
jgi:hypothetical protein